jgi:hypothetical protein
MSSIEQDFFAQPEQRQVDESHAIANYANFCRLISNPEELLIDFGVNLQLISAATPPILVTDRVVTSWYTARRLVYVLQQCVARHESAFGVLETDVQKRLGHSLPQP